MAIDELITLRKKLLKNVKDELKDRLGLQTKGLEKYYNEYKRELSKGYLTVSSKKELLEKLYKQDIILCGDYHTLEQAQNTAYKIILELIKKREVVICLELINYDKQDHLDRYINQEILEQDFLSLINYKENWGFNWKNYLPFFKTAIKNNLKIYGVNKAPNSLEIRDQIAAKTIVDITLKHPTALIFVLFGDLHIASNHLPKQIKLQLREQKLKRNIFQVFQNSEQIYWQILERESHTNIDVVKVKAKSYCIQNTPPWVKLQSYLIWSEHGEELLNKEALHHFKENEVLKNEDLDDEEFSRTDIIKEQFFYILEILCNFYKIDHGTLVDPKIFSIDDLNLKEELEEATNISKSRYREIVEQILVRKTYYIQEQNIIFLSSYSLNHAAHSAAIFLFFQLAGTQTIEEEGHQKEREEFYRRVLVDAIGFLGSKIVNPKRKSFEYSDHMEYYETFKFSKSPSKIRKKKIAKFAMQHKLQEDKITSGKSSSIRLKEIYNMDTRLSYGISKTIGYQLGNALYFAMIYNVIDQEQIFDLVKTPLSETNRAYKKYIDLLIRLKPYKPEHISKTEFF